MGVGVRGLPLPEHPILTIGNIDDPSLVAVVLGQHPCVLVPEHVGDLVDRNVRLNERVAAECRSSFGDNSLTRASLQRL
jgi:hypothetical protein